MHAGLPNLRAERETLLFCSADAAADLGVSIRAAAGMLRRLVSAGAVRTVGLERGHLLYEVPVVRTRRV